MKRHRRLVIQAFVFLVIAGAASGIWFSERSVERKTLDSIPRPVRTAMPERRDIEESVEAWGNLKSANQVSILPKVSGSITAVFAMVGDTVSEGDVIAEIDRETYLLDLRRAEAARTAASSTWERLDRLYEAGNATRQDWENARAVHLASDAQASAAGLRYDWTRITSPVSGVVLMRHATTGDLVSPGAGTPLYTVGSLEELELELRLPESYYPGFAGMSRPEVEFIAEAFPFLSLRGAIKSVAPWIDPGSRTFAVVCRVYSEEGILRPGMLVGARFITDLHPDTLTLPDSSLSGRDGFWSVDTNGQARYRGLDQPVLSGGYVVVPDTWEGERFVIDGQHFLKEGDALREIDR